METALNLLAIQKYSLSALTFLLIFFLVNAMGDAYFNENYVVIWGENHVQYLDQGSGFGSRRTYLFGFIDLQIKLPPRDSAGTVTAFYLTSHTDNHDEIDFEFLGNSPGKPYVVQTNVFANGYGNREQRIHLWFDPTADFHRYRILWNQFQIVLLVDNVPIRVLENKTKEGATYPSQAMQVITSLWDGEDWATDGGLTKTNWSNAPFVAQFRGFAINGCPSHDHHLNSSSSSYSDSCFSHKWMQYKTLTPRQKRMLKMVRKHYMVYDYCSDRSRYPQPPPECPST
eukprot:Gb_10500 [translate_table: standard]